MFEGLSSEVQTTREPPCAVPLTGTAVAVSSAAMTQLLACSCGLDPATETMAAQAGIAIAISAPYWFRDQIMAAARRLRGRFRDPEPDGCADDDVEGGPG